MSHNLRANKGFQALRRAFGFLPPLRGKVRMGGCYDTSSAGGPLTLSLSREGRGNLVPSIQIEELELGLVACVAVTRDQSVPQGYDYARCAR